MRAQEKAIRARREEHHVAGQINAYVLDRESYRTGYGAHNRLVVEYHSAVNAFEVREDVTGLPHSTERDRYKVIKEEWPEFKPSKVDAYTVESSEDGRTVYHAYWCRRFE